MKNMTDAEKSAKDALMQYKCPLGGGTEWYTAKNTGESAVLINKFKKAVANK